MTLAESYAALEISPTADLSSVQQAFRRLVRLTHPDVNPDPAVQQRFMRVVRAYQKLKAEFTHSPGDGAAGPCRRCGRAGELFPALDGGISCLECLLGISQKRRFLPMPASVIVRHVLVLALYAAAVCGLVLFAESGDMRLVALSAASVATGMLVLAIQVFGCTPRALLRSRA